MFAQFEGPFPASSPSKALAPIEIWMILASLPSGRARGHPGRPLLLSHSSGIFELLSVAISKQKSKLQWSQCRSAIVMLPTLCVTKSKMLDSMSIRLRNPYLGHSDMIQNSSVIESV